MCQTSGRYIHQSQNVQFRFFVRLVPSSYTVLSSFRVGCIYHIEASTSIPARFLSSMTTDRWIYVGIGAGISIIVAIFTAIYRHRKNKRMSTVYIKSDTPQVLAMTPSYPVNHAPHLQPVIVSSCTTYPGGQMHPIMRNDGQHFLPTPSAPCGDNTV